jgi:maltose O-acetyltransferase
MVTTVLTAALTTSAILLFQHFRSSWALRQLLSKRRKAAASSSEQVRLMLKGEPYSIECEVLQTLLFGCHDICLEYNRLGSSSPHRNMLLKELLGSFPEDSPPYIEAPFHCDYGIHTTVGKNFYANFSCVFLDCAKITIGDNVFLAPKVQLYTAAHPLDALERRATEFAKPITIGDDVWIGGGAIVLPGVTIGNRVVVAAGSVVSKDIPDDVVVGGVPAKVLKKLK